MKISRAIATGNLHPPPQHSIHGPRRGRGRASSAPPPCSGAPPRPARASAGTGRCSPGARRTARPIPVGRGVWGMQPVRQFNIAIIMPDQRQRQQRFPLHSTTNTIHPRPVPYLVRVRVAGELRLPPEPRRQRRSERLLEAGNPRVGRGQGRVLRVGRRDAPLRDELVLRPRRLEVEIALFRFLGCVGCLTYELDGTDSHQLPPPSQPPQSPAYRDDVGAPRRQRLHALDEQRGVHCHDGRAAELAGPDVVVVDVVFIRLMR